MKATARVIIGSVKARAIGISQGVGVAACGLQTGVDATAQMWVWLTPGNTVDYTIITNLDWKII